MSDQFNYVDLTKWNATPYFAPDFGYSCGSWAPGETWLHVTGESGGVGDTQAHLGWKFHHTLPSPCSGPFNVTLELRWEEDNDGQMDHVRLSLDNASGDYQVNVGFEDSWSGSGERGRQAVINGVRTYSGGLPLVGQAIVNVVRNASSVVTATWNGLVWAQGTCAASITRIGLWLLTTRWDDGASGGVNYIDASFTNSDYQFADDFDYLNPTLWEAEPYFSPAFGYACGHWSGPNSYLYIENTTGGAGDTAGQVGWKFYHTLPAAYDGQFEIWFDISWAEHSLSQMDHVCLSLDDASGDYQVNVGFEDSWAATPGGKAAYINDEYTFQGGLPLSGDGHLLVRRDQAGLVRAYWDDYLFAQGVCTAAITKVGLWLYGCKYYAGVSCGVDFISAHFSTAGTTTTDSSGLLLLAALGVVSASVIVVVIAVYRVRSRRLAPTTTASSVASAGSAPVYCPVCGSPIDPGDQFCYRCGARRSG